MMRRSLTLAVLVLALVGSACGGGTTTATFELVSAIEGHALVQEPPSGLVVLDVRTPDEFDQARLADAVNIDFYRSDFEQLLDDLDKDTPYFVYCRSGNRSSTTIELMKDLGFTEVYELDGGIVSWAQAGLPLE